MSDPHKSFEHTHVDKNGNVYTHSHDEGELHHGHAHTHTHDPKHIKAVVNRLARCEGHLAAVKRMVENQVDCSDVLIQLAAVRSELNNAGKLLLKEHISHCIVEAVEENDEEAIEKLNTVIDKFIKY